jgi:hypothetical protein
MIEKMVEVNLVCEKCKLIMISRESKIKKVVGVVSEITIEIVPCVCQELSK